MNNVIKFPGVTKLDINPETVLHEALDASLKAVIIVGFDFEGNEYFVSSQADGGEVLWHLERAKHRLMRLVDKDIGEDT